MSSSRNQKELDINLGRGAAGLHVGSENIRGPGIIGAQPIVAGQQYANQTTLLVSNEPTTVVSHEQRLASNQPVTTEKHISKEYVPVTYEEIVTTVPIVTGQAVHTGQAIGGEKYTQQLGMEYVQQQAATKIDLIPNVQTQLGPQQVVNVPVNQPPQLVGKTTVIPSHQAMAQTTTTTTMAGGLGQTGFIGTQPLATQITGVRPATQMVEEVITTQTRPIATQVLGTQPIGTQFVGTQPLGTQFVGTQPIGTQFVGTQPIGTQFTATQPLINQPLSTPLAGVGHTSGISANVGANIQKKTF